MIWKKDYNCGAICAYSVAVIGAFLVVGWLVWTMNNSTRPAPLGEGRAAERRKTLADVRTADADILGNPNFVWEDQPKGIVRMPINQAMDLSVKLWQNPAQARSNLLARLQKKFPPPVNYD